MVKLTDRKSRWIIREKSKGGVLSTAGIARLQNVSEPRVRQLLSEYRKTGNIHVLNKPGRPLRNISRSEISTVVSVFRQYPCNALTLERTLLNRHGITMSINHTNSLFILLAFLLISLSISFDSGILISLQKLKSSLPA